MKSWFAIGMAHCVGTLAMGVMFPFNFLLWVVGINNPWKKFGDFMDGLIEENLY